MATHATLTGCALGQRDYEHDAPRQTGWSPDDLLDHISALLVSEHFGTLTCSRSAFLLRPEMLWVSNCRTTYARRPFCARGETSRFRVHRRQRYAYDQPEPQLEWDRCRTPFRGRYGTPVMIRAPRSEVFEHIHDVTSNC